MAQKNETKSTETLLTINKSLSVEGDVTVTGTLNGNATSATKAAQDGNGNNIVDTYVPQIKYLAGGVDLNTVVTSGFYRLHTEPTNGPGGINYGQLIVSHAGADTAVQLAFPYSSSTCYIRTASGVGSSTPSWRAWRCVTFNDQFSYSNGTLTIDLN